MPNPAEVATVIAGGHRFADWETVWVQQRWGEDSTLFRFTATERDPSPANWTTLRFKPNDECAIYLGGQLGCAGVILTRQTAYDANNHGVMLMGKGKSWYAARGSILDKDGNYDNQTFEQVAEKVIKPFGVNIKKIGKLDATPFKRLQKEPSDTVWQFLERIARPLGIIIGSDHRGSILLIGEHKFQAVDGVVEGQNILRCQATISVEDIRSDIVLRGQTAASDENAGSAASEQEARVTASAKRYSPLLVHAEQPVWNVAELKKRAKNEARWSEGTMITATVVVQGWHRKGGKLWEAGEHVHIKSPMAMLDQELKLRSVTFTQDDKGTLTTLDLVVPWLLGAKSDVNPGNPNSPTEPGNDNAAPASPATPSDTPAETLPRGPR